VSAGPAPGNDLEAMLLARGLRPVRRPGQRAWQGRIGGRTVLVSAMPNSRTRYAGEVRLRQHTGWRLLLELDTPVRTRFLPLAASTAGHPVMRGLHRLRGLVQLPGGTALPGRVIVTSDPAWAQSLLQRPDAMALARDLFDAQATKGPGASVYLMANSATGRLCYGSSTLPADGLTGEFAAWLLDRLGRLADAVERLPPPQVPVKIGAFGRWMERHPVLALLLMLALALVVLGGTVLGLLLLAVWLLAR